MELLTLGTGMATTTETAIMEMTMATLMEE